MAGTTPTNPAQPDTAPVLTTRTIKTTPHNAHQVQRLIKQDPELLALVQGLQAQGFFPGLRGVTVTLTGSPEHCAQGLQGLLDAQQKANPC